LSKRLPILSGKEIIKALAKVGFVPVRQKGSHVFLRHVDGRRVDEELVDGCVACSFSFVVVA